MKVKFPRMLAAAAMVALAGAGTAAQARDVRWSVGVNAAPGVAIGLGNAPVYVAPQPVYMAPRPVYVAPAPVYYAPPPVYLAPAPVYYAPPPVTVYYGPTYGGGYRGHGGHRHWR
jgi:hypothetical protein